MFSMSKNYIVFDSMMVPPQKNIFLLLYCIIFDNKFLLILRNSKLLSINFLCVTLSHMSISTRVVVAVAFQQVDSSPDTETGTQCDDESLKNGYCAVEKCHKCVPPCTLRPCGLMNSDFPSACAPANGQTYSQVSNFNQEPGYVKRRQLAAPSYSVVCRTPMTSSLLEQTYLA